jgi:hypothetical protein
VSVDANTLTARREGVILTMTWSAALAARLVTASEHPPLGWYSSTLDQKHPAITAVMTAPPGLGASSQISLEFDLTIETKGSAGEPSAVRDSLTRKRLSSPSH